MWQPVDSPFNLEPVEEVPLGVSPLESVTFQIRFPAKVSRLGAALSANELQERLASSYPYAQEQPTFNLVFQPGQSPEQQPGPTVWTLQDPTQSWVCSLSSDSVALTTTAYESRGKFVDRARELLQAVEGVAEPPSASRLGVRYVNRVTQPSTGDEDWIQSLAQGARGILVATSWEERRHVINSLSQVLYQWPGEVKKIQGRWGVLPPNGLMDPATPAIPEESWVLDIDSFHDGVIAFNADELSKTIMELASRAYRFFRWVVAPQALERFEPKGAE